jgi:hypothetical protein
MVTNIYLYEKVHLVEFQSTVFIVGNLKLEINCKKDKNKRPNPTPFRLINLRP